MRRAAAVGAAGTAIVAAYLATALLTASWSGRQVRPLFEGVGPAQPYQWVKPPPQFAATNVPPKSGANDIPFVNGQTPAAVAATPDSQFIVNFSAKAFPPQSGATGVHVTTNPLDPATLGPVPSGGHADGNAYRIQFAYRPAAAPVGTLAAPADVIVNAPSPTAGLLYSTDGTTWKQITSQQVGGPSTVGGSFAGPGYYLAFSSGAAPTPANAGKSGGGIGTILIAVAVVAVAARVGRAGLGHAAATKSWRSRWRRPRWTCRDTSERT